MGWSFPSGATRKNIIADRTRSWARQGIVTKCLRYTTRGNVLWSVWERIFLDNRRERWICCDILQRSVDGWGYKNLDESMHPYYYTCPPLYLRLVPEVTCLEWRNNVLLHHKRIMAKRQEIRKSTPSKQKLS